MAATYWNHGEPYRESLHSAQSASVYSTDSASSPLDSIIRDYPLVPGASPNAFQFSPNSYSPSQRTPVPSGSKSQQYQQQPGTPTRLRQLQSPPGENVVTIPKPSHMVSDTRGQTHDSSPLLHTQFRSPAESISADSHRPDSAQTDVPPPENFIDLRESGAYEQIEVLNTQQSAPGFNSYGAHGVPPRTGHGVTPLMQFGKAAPLTQKYGEQQVFRLTPDIIEVKAEFPKPNPAIAVSAYGQHTMQTTGLTVNGDDSYDRNSWGTQYSEQNLARQTWQTTTSGITNGGDPFSFRHFESPQASAVVPQDPKSNFSAPKLVVHSPPAHDTSHYTINHTYSSEQHHEEQIVEEDDMLDSYAYVPPSPIEAVPQGRMPSKVPVANRYNFSRPMRTELRVSNVSTASTNHTPARGSEYSAMSTSTDMHIPNTISGFPDPPMPESLPPSSYFPQPQNLDQSTRRAMKRMSVPKTMPNLVYTDEQLSPSPARRDIPSNNSPHLTAPPLSGSPRGPEPGLVPKNLSPIGDRSRSPSPSESLRYHASSPLPGPPRSYDVPYSYRVTVTDHQYHTNGYNNGATSSQSEHSSGSHHTRYSHGGSVLPPAPKEVIALPSSPPPVGPRPGSGLSLYSRYSFYSAGDLPESAAPTPRGWEKGGNTERLRKEGSTSPSRSDSTPTPTGGKNKGKGKEIDDYSGLPYLSVPQADSTGLGPMSAATDQSGISPQECLLLGISHHEADRLEESAYWFEKAANENGGCGVGMFMWGLSLRHAWGVERDERAAFWWLRRAAECAVQDMERTAQARPEGGDASDVEKERDRKAVQSELVLAVYEVGQCFFHGWGVETDKKMAVSYFQVAARLGDMDAQLELGFCFAKGKGCKKDLKEAAKWYRAAAAQGASTIGLAWIYKPKYGGPGGDEQFTDNSAPILPLSKGIIAPSTPSAKSSTGKSEPRRLKKPPPRSRTPSSTPKSPAPADMARSFIDESGY